MLPLGASKGSGVEWLLGELGHDPKHLMALGDGGERRVGGLHDYTQRMAEMLQLAALGVAMGNA